MVKNSSSQIGSGFAAIVVILAIAFLSALGFVFWQNFIQSKDVVQLTDNATLSSLSNQPEAAAVIDPNEGYLVLKDWGVRFKLLTDLGEVLAYKKTISNQNGTFESYSLTTKRVEGLGQQCVPNDNGDAIRLSSISRRTVKQEQYSSAFPANNNEPIDGYYYYVSGGQSICSEEHTDWQSADNIMTSELLSNPEAIK